MTDLEKKESLEKTLANLYKSLEDTSESNCMSYKMKEKSDLSMTVETTYLSCQSILDAIDKVEIKIFEVSKNLKQ